MAYRMKGFSGFKDSPLKQDVETKTKSTKRVDKSRSRLLAGGDPSELTYTTKSGSEIEAIDIKKKTKKGKSGETKKVKEIVVHGGGDSKTKRIQKVTKSGKVKTKTVTWRDGKRVVTRTIADEIDTSPILNSKNNSPLKQNPFYIPSAKTEKYDIKGGGEGVKKTYKHLFTGRTKTKETQTTDKAKRKETIIYNKDGSVKSVKRKRTNK